MNSNVLRVNEDERIGLTVRNLTVTVLDKKSRTHNQSRWPSLNKNIEKTQLSDIEAIQPKKILDGISFDLASGETLAIMGGSGSGKTTLLNTLSQRMNISEKSLAFDGIIAFFRDKSSGKIESINSAYLLQTDMFLPGLSVYETLSYQADLRLDGINKEDKTVLIKSLLAILGLTKVENEPICSFSDPSNTSLSGGEQRRVSLAIQLLARPSILFLDEPTTGLDSNNAYNLVQCVKELSNFGMTVVLSIHQPRLEILNLFDKICLLTRGGRLIYFGSYSNAYNYFDTIGFHPPQGENMNIIDYLMDLSVKDSRSVEQERVTEIRINELVDSWKLHSQSTLLPYEESRSSKEIFETNVKLFGAFRSLSFFREVMVLTRRSFLTTRRDNYSLIALNGGALILAIVTGWMFYKPHPDLAGIRSITSAIYSMIEIVGFSPLIFESERLWGIEGRYFFREKSENLVSAAGFLISRRLAKFFLEDLTLPLIFSVITYFMWGLRTDNGASNFFIYFSVTLLANLIGMTVAMLSFSITSEFAYSSLLMNLYYQIQNCACGYFINAKTMPVYVRWTKYIAYVWYAFGALCANQFTDWIGDCDPSSQDCTEFTGNYNLMTLGYPENWIKEPICIIFAWYIGFFAIAILCLHCRNDGLVMAKQKSNTIGGEAHEDMNQVYNMRSNLEEAETSIRIDIKDVNLSVLIKRKRDELPLLNNISARFRANRLNAIMGPSGSGKTTLLNYLAGRLSVATTYQTSGEIYLNGNEVTQKEFASICSYVVQHDRILLPTLTVRETLYFQAQLRLPPRLHSEAPNIINDLIRKMGLNDCADTLIGSESVKGVSGGEKRRVSIAIQLLNNPKVLLLDEPTSGLDSSTATYILELLQQLAMDGTTVIMTIHQPKSELFGKFSDILLLARGGFVSFNGEPTTIENYFARLGYPCPTSTNIADHILDLVSKSVNEDLTVSDERVSAIINAWEDFGEDEANDKDEAMEECYGPMVNLSDYIRKPVPFYTSLKVVTKRHFLGLIRSKDVMASRMSQIIFLGIIHTLYFTPLSRSKGTAAVNNRLGLIQEVLNLYFVGLLNNVGAYPHERDVFYQEHKDNIYGTLTFSTSYLINELPTEIIPCFFFSALIVFAVGLPRNAAMFFSMFYSSFVAVNCGESLGIMTNTIFNHLGLATNLLASLSVIAIFMGGVMSLHMPSFFRALNWINPMGYAVTITANLGLKDVHFGCDGLDTCLLDSGNAVLKSYNLEHDIAPYFAGLTACLVLYRVISIIVLHIRMKWFN